MIQIIPLGDLSPNDKQHVYKEALRQARINLLNAEMIVGPMDSRYERLDTLIATLEEMIVEK